MILALWSPPRARSTVFYRAMLERGDLLALHEPFCNLADYGETDIGQRKVHTATELIDLMHRESARIPIFFKDTTDHRYPEMLENEGFLRETKHTFLIRRPAEIAVSFLAIKPDMVVQEVGLRMLHEIYCRVRDLSGEKPVVVDSDDLVSAPAETMAAYCAAVGLPFLPQALHWAPGSRREWSRTDRWHERVNQTTGIVATESRPNPELASDPRVREFAAHHEPFYQELYANRLRLA
ncbi:MAG TPA: hypothetical protein VFC19_36150 [Candidatus Limnocylindrales bacterium]|nr:hypothetical protein [Candidatus Limnocylindrales bacterium]